MNQAKAMAASWARSFLSASLACWMAGITDWQTIGYAGAAAVAPVILRWLNPKDKDFGVK